MTTYKAVHHKLVVKFLGMSLIVIGCLMLLSAGIGLLYNEADWFAFIQSAVITLSSGALLFFVNPASHRESISIRDGFLIILAQWIFVPAFGMLPFYLASPINTLADSFFESYAGFTTTGFTNLDKFDILPHCVIFWRVVIQWLGGMGLMIFIIALFPLLKSGEFKIFFSDIQDTSYKPLHNKITTTARRLWFIYFTFTVIGIFALFLAGQNWFDAVCFSLSSISTGGGVPFNGNITHLSIEIKSVIALLMLIAGANYFFVFQVFRKQKNITSEEFIVYLLIFVFATLIITFYEIYIHGYNKLMIFESVFNTISFVSTTGFYTNAVFDTSLLFVWMMLFFLMFIGSSTGSSGGGINVYRIIVIFKTLSYYIKTILHPNSYNQLKFNGKPIELKSINKIYAFFVLYILVFLFGSIVLSFFGFNFNNAIGFCASALSNSGPGVFLLNGYTDLSQIHIGSKISLIILMIIGRIELFPFLIIFSKTFWRP